jgi:hypothetical protein
MPKNAFRKGFADGWSSIQGSAPAPTTPAYSVEPGKNPYRAGIIRGVQEACAKQPVNATATTDAWLDNALRRRYRRSSS